MRAGRRGRVGVLTLVVCGALGAANAQAATVDLHAAPAATGAGDCSSAPDACTVLAAVASANAQATSDTVRISLADGTYPLSAATPTALAVTFTGPSVTIAAAAGAHPVLDGGSATRLLSIAAGSTVVVQGVDFANGDAGAGLGGAISNNGTLTVRDATFSGNTADNGGAIISDAGSATTVQESTFTQNAATGIGGGAIIVRGTATVTRSAFLGNTAQFNGGAINVQPTAVLTLSRSTLSGNVSGGLGGALSYLGSQLIVQGSTFTANQATGGSVLASGGAGATFAADVIGPQAGGDACSPATTAFTDAGYNLDVDGTCISNTTPATGSHNGTTVYGTSTYGQVLQAYLGAAPADNGGPTQTVALLETPSPATDLADPALDVVPSSFALPAAIDGQTGACASADQRGVLPAAGATCDVGAYFLQRLAPPPAPSADVPQCRDLAASTPFGTALDLPLQCSATVWNWAVTQAPAHGTLGSVDSNGRITYTPEPGFSGDDAFQYVAQGGSGQSAPATVVVHVAAGPAGTASSAGTTTTPRTCAPRHVTVRLNPSGVRFVRARVSVDGIAVQPAHRGARWTVGIQLQGAPGQTVTVRISGRRDDGRVVRRTRTLTVC